MMNLYDKLVKAKKTILSTNIKKSGRNTFSQYDYFELADFLPKIIELEAELKFCCNVSFGAELATLTIVDTENPLQEIVITSPMSSASLKGMHDVQNLGAVQTYLRRYLYMSAFEIVEHDAIDAGKVDIHADMPHEISTKVNPESPITKEQYEELRALCSDSNGRLISTKIARLKEIYNSIGYKAALDIKQKDFEEVKNKLSSLPFEVKT